MLWGQGLVSFAIWLGVSAAVARRPRLALAGPRGRALFLATAYLFGGLLFLMLGTIAAVVVHGLMPDHMTPVGWLLVTGAGAGFVLGQAMAVRVILTMLNQDSISKHPPNPKYGGDAPGEDPKPS